MPVIWNKPKPSNWYKLDTVDLTHSHFDNLEGVYIIWQCNVTTGNVVKVGQGDVRDRLQKHRNDKDIQSYNTGGLSVTWTAIPKGQQDGVEKFLGNHYTPKVAARFPDATPIPVNLPKNE